MTNTVKNDIAGFRTSTSQRKELCRTVAVHSISLHAKFKVTFYALLKNTMNYIVLLDQIILEGANKFGGNLKLMAQDLLNEGAKTNIKLQ